jgi:hypothetical protein
VQEPLAEYCSLWRSANPVELFGYEALYVDIHPLKPLLGNIKVPLLRAMEHALIDAVCEVGVDLISAVQHDHLASMLAFVGGLGLRKGEALKQGLRFVIINRSLISYNYLYFFVFMPFWLVYMVTHGINLLAPSFVIYISKQHHHHHQEEVFPDRRA